MNTTSFEKLSKKLAELFQLDQADLDFGIYRIMNARRDEINTFLNKELLPQVRTAFARYQSGDKSGVQKELDKLLTSLKDAGVPPEHSPKVQELQAKLNESAVDVTAMENEVYDHLYRFFGRYYDEGDFISMRRYKEGVYAIPYEGEEVKLHWANADQYYIKTTENFQNYTFKVVDDHRVHFRIVEADTEKDNIKASNGNDRRFLLSDEKTVYEEDGELVIHFEYKPDTEKRKQDAINADAVSRIMAMLTTGDLMKWHARLTPKWKRADGSASDKTLLEKHLSEYTKRNTFDYFIHKDLKGFLRRELDFYIKNEVMRLDDIEGETVPRVEQYLAKIKVIRQIAHKIIDFLAQIEEFQKKLWLKKKFVVETNYCITLDRVPEELYSEIAANDAQREEWIKLYAIDEIKGDLAEPGYTNPLTVEFLKVNDKLVLDTRFFLDDFKIKLLDSIENIDEKCDGVLIHSENFQALNYLQERYKGEIKFIYIDPPYNTASTPILYKNEYRHSSWNSLMRDRLAISCSLLTRDGVKTVAIDDTELINLSQILDSLFTEHRVSKVTVIHNPKGSITKDFNRVHEYAVFLTKENDKHAIARTLKKNKTPRKMRRWGENSRRTDRRLSFYPIYLNEGKIVRVGEVPSDDFHPNSRNVLLNSGEIEVWPIDQDGVERRWNFGLDTIHENLHRIIIQEVDSTLDLFLTHELTVPKTVWTGGEFDAGNYGNTLLIDILGSKKFDFPKSINLVKRCIHIGTAKHKNCTLLDYFAGSGTTAHATIELNKEDSGNRKYILVEMGDHFNQVVKHRIAKVVYSPEWKNSKPVFRNKGISHFLKYLKLESYEDSLANIVFSRSKNQQLALEKKEDFRESYLLKYILDSETQNSQSLLNITQFDDPFNYKLLIGTGSVGETKEVNADLVETFNWLIGLRVKHINSFEGFHVVEGTNPKDEKVLIIWRKIRELSETNPARITELRQQANKNLDTFFKKQKYNTLDMEFDLIYVNGDNNLMNIPVPGMADGEPRYKVRLIEEEFSRFMFDVKDV